MRKNAALETEPVPANLQTLEEENQMLEEENRLSEQEETPVFDYHPVPPLSIIRIKARVRSISIGQPMPYDLSAQELGP